MLGVAALFHGTVMEESYKTAAKTGKAVISILGLEDKDNLTSNYETTMKLL